MANSPSIDFSRLYTQETGADMDIIIPESGFIRDYYEFARELTGAPPFFHVMVGFSLISAVLGRKVYLPIGANYVYPNTWTVLIAPSSLYFKSTAITIGKRLLMNIDKGLVFPDEYSPEKLMDILADRSDGIFTWSELGATLARMEKNYMQGTKEMFTELYDNPPTYVRKLKSETKEIEQPCISILAATAMDWFRKWIREDDLKGGFLARFLLVPAIERGPRLPIPPAPDKQKKRELVDRLKQFQQLDAGANIGPEAEAIYRAWYLDSDDKMMADPEADTVASFHTRMAVYALKYALLYEITATGELVISPDSMTRAITLIDKLKDDLRKLLSDELVFGKEAQELQKVEKLIKQNPGITRSELLRRAKTNAKTLDILERTLLERKDIRIDYERTGTSKTKIYFWDGKK
jgi:hypothetical protein